MALEPQFWDLCSPIRARRLIPALSALGLRIVNSGRGAEFTTLAVCAYIVGLAVPLKWDIPLLALGIGGVLAVGTRTRTALSARSPLAVPVVVFLAATGLSTLLSADIARSLKLSTPLLPGVLLFFLVAHPLDGTHQVRRLFGAFSVVGLGVASVVLWAAWSNRGISLEQL